MKLTSFAIIFIIIITPFLLISGIQSRMMCEDYKLRAYYDQVIDNSVQDAVFMLSSYRHKSVDDTGLTMQNIREITAETFLDSLYYAFGVHGDITGMARVKGCVPILLFLENDSYSIYALNEFKGSDGYRIIDYCWYPKKPYSGEMISDDYTVSYTLSDTVYIFDRVNNQELTGPYNDFKDLMPAFGTQAGFDVLRLAAVSKSIEKDLKYFIGHFNSFNAQMGVTCEFRFPQIQDADWVRALTDEGLLVLAQNFPVITGKRYDYNAFGGARIIRKPNLVGYIDDHKKVYCKDTCAHFVDLQNDPGFDPESIIHFTDAREAALEGHYPCSLCRP